MATRNRFKDDFSVNEIGTGNFYTAGSFKSRKRTGLAGALRSAKSKGARTYTKNLSGKDLKTFQGLIGDELKKQPKNTGGLSRAARRNIMQQAEQARKQGKMSTADKKDLQKIVKALGNRSQQNTSSNQPTRRDSSSKTAQPKTNNRIAKNPIRTLVQSSYDRLATRKQVSGNPKMKQKLTKNTSKASGIKTAKAKKVVLPDTKNLPDMDIG